MGTKLCYTIVSILLEKHKADGDNVSKEVTQPKQKKTRAEHKSWLKKWGSLIVLSLALAIIIIDTTLLNVSLGAIIRELNTDIQSLQWVITAYALTLAAFTITGGRLGDLYGRKRTFMLGAVLFAAGSLLASFAHSVGVLLIGESIIEGIGAALMMPATASLLISSFKGKERAIAFGVWGGVAGAASAVGPILGGWLSTNYSWRWGFRINVFVVMILLIGSVLISESRDTQEKPTLDWGGVLLSATGLFALVFAIIESSTYGWWKAKSAFLFGSSSLKLGGLSVTPVALMLGAVLLTSFFVWERHVERKGRTPLVSLKLFKNYQFTSGMATLSIVSLALTGLIFALPVFFQGVVGLDALHTGLALLPLSISLFIASPLSIVLTKWLTPKRIIQIGLALTVAAFYVLYRTIAITSVAADLVGGLVLFGVGMGFVQSQINNLTLSAVSQQQAGEASGVNNTMRQIGSSLGSAILGAVLLTTLATSLSTGVVKSGVIPSMYKTKIAAAVQAQSSNVEFGGGAQLSQPLPTAIRTEIKRISNQATTDGVRTSLLYGLAFAVLSFLAALSLPNVKNLEKDESLANSGH